MYLAEELGKRGLAHVHLNDNYLHGERAICEEFLKAFKQANGGTVLLASGMTREHALRLVDEGTIDIAAFGQPFISNPDLVARLQQEIALVSPDRDTCYGGDREGYLDYPTAS